jgi:DNA-directed RNA polymerase subunit RPC12/RpoP
MATEEVRCPKCRAALTPDEIRRADPAIDCPFCRTRVLVKRPPAAVALVPVAIAKPTPFIVVEEPVTDMVVGDGGPFRSAAVPVRPTLSITWKEPGARAAAIASAVIASIAAICGAAGAVSAAVGIGLCAILAMWFAVSMAVNTMRLTASRDALVVRAGRMPGPRLNRQDVQLPAADIVQLYVIEQVTTSEDGTTRRYLLIARDRHGKDHDLCRVHTPEEAWWLEERVERHLGIVDKETAVFEHRRPLELPAGGKPD